MPTAAANTMAPRARLKVTGKRAASSLATVRPLNSDEPRSPDSTPPSHRPYCSSNGSSRPSSSRISSTRVSDASSPPAMVRAGSPGTASTSAKTAKLISSSRGMSPSRRRAM